MVGLQRVWRCILSVIWGFLPEQNILLLPSLSPSTPLLLDRFLFTSLLFSLLQHSHFGLDTVEELREIEGECPRRRWLHLYAVTQSYWTESGIGSPQGFVVTHILPIDCVEAA